MKKTINKILNAIDSDNEELVESLIADVYLIDDTDLKVGILNELLVTSGHYQHQEITDRKSVV